MTSFIEFMHYANPYLLISFPEHNYLYKTLISKHLQQYIYRQLEPYLIKDIASYIYKRKKFTYKHQKVKISLYSEMVHVFSSLSSTQFLGISLKSCDLNPRKSHYYIQQQMGWPSSPDGLVLLTFPYPKKQWKMTIIAKTLSRHFLSLLVSDNQERFNWLANQLKARLLILNGNKNQN